MIKHIIRRHAPLIADVMFKYALYIFIVCKRSISHVIFFFRNKIQMVAWNLSV